MENLKCDSSSIYLNMMQINSIVSNNNKFINSVVLLTEYDFALQLFYY